MLFEFKKANRQEITVKMNYGLISRVPFQVPVPLIESELPFPLKIRNVRGTISPNLPCSVGPCIIGRPLMAFSEYTPSPISCQLTLW